MDMYPEMSLIMDAIIFRTKYKCTMLSFTKRLLLFFFFVNTKTTTTTKTAFLSKESQFILEPNISDYGE